MKLYPIYVHYPRWPGDGDKWIHPEDRQTATRLLPSERVFRCDGVADGYNVLRYGDAMLRVKPMLWEEVDGEGFDVGDDIEIRSRMGQNDPGLGVIREMTWADSLRRIYYYLRMGETDLEKPFFCEDLKTLGSDEDEVVI